MNSRNLWIRRLLDWLFSCFSDSPEERKAVQTACSYLNSCNLGVSYSSAEISKPNLQFELEGEKALWPGQPIDLNILIKNETGGSWTVNLAASCQLESYTGKVEASLATIKQTVATEGKPGMFTKAGHPILYAFVMNVLPISFHSKCCHSEPFLCLCTTS